LSKVIIRVYGIFINPCNEVLLVEEEYSGLRFTKFAGGGLQHGESTVECLKREFLEEFNCPVKIDSHFYTTDFYQPSAFDASHQILSIYYKINIDQAHLPLFSAEPNIAIKYKNISLLNCDDVTFPIDKHVVKLLINMR
jgi:8-oxo-dGTP pyrophosphatase MutT (NUDIX family)